MKKASAAGSDPLAVQKPPPHLTGESQAESRSSYWSPSPWHWRWRGWTPLTVRSSKLTLWGGNLSVNAWYGLVFILFSVSGGEDVLVPPPDEDRWGLCVGVLAMGGRGWWQCPWWC